MINEIILLEKKKKYDDLKKINWGPFLKDKTKKEAQESLYEQIFEKDNEIMK